MLAMVLAVAVSGLHFDCAGPITPAMPASAILSRFGKDARRGEVTGADGRPVKGVVLYGDDPARRLEIAFWDEAQTAVESVTAGATATAWTGPLGLHAGSSLDEVRILNGHNFGIGGFGWLYGGYITNAWGGKLTPAGGCAVQVRFAIAGKIPKAIHGELDLNSKMPEVKAADPHVDRLSVSWPLPAGIRMSDDGKERLGF